MTRGRVSRQHKRRIGIGQRCGRGHVGSVVCEGRGDTRFGVRVSVDRSLSGFNRQGRGRCGSYCGWLDIRASRILLLGSGYRYRSGNAKRGKQSDKKSEGRKAGLAWHAIPIGPGQATRSETGRSTRSGVTSHIWSTGSKGPALGNVTRKCGPNRPSAELGTVWSRRAHRASCHPRPG